MNRVLATKAGTADAGRSAETQGDTCYPGDPGEAVREEKGPAAWSWQRLLRRNDLRLRVGGWEGPEQTGG